jgi:predicted LPLAT superfamily acyltransferase
MHWAEINEFTTSTGIKFAFGVYKLFGRIPVRLILYPTILWYLVVHPIARKASRDYLTNLYVYTKGLSPKPSLPNILRHFLAFGECILDKLIIWSGNIKDVPHSFIADESFKETVKNNQGAIIVVSHTGNLDLSRAIAKDFPKLNLTVLVHTIHAMKFNELIREINPESAINTLQVSEFNIEDAISFSQKIEKGEMIAIAGDRVPLSGHGTIETKFLGESALLPIGPYALSRILKCPLYSLSSIKVNGNYLIKIREIGSSKELHINKANGVRKVAQEFADNLTDICMQAPFQWFNFYPFWVNKNGKYDDGR